MRRWLVHGLQSSAADFSLFLLEANGAFRGHLARRRRRRQCPQMRVGGEWMGRQSGWWEHLMMCELSSIATFTSAIHQLWSLLILDQSEAHLPFLSYLQPTSPLWCRKPPLPRDVKHSQEQHTDGPVTAPTRAFKCTGMPRQQQYHTVEKKEVRINTVWPSFIGCMVYWLPGWLVIIWSAGVWLIPRQNDSLIHLESVFDWLIKRPESGFYARWSRVATRLRL